MVQWRWMFADYDNSHLQSLIEDQASLARIAVSPEVRAMHLELEALYRSQLICALSSEKLGAFALGPADLKLAA